MVLLNEVLRKMMNIVFVCVLDSYVSLIFAYDSWIFLSTQLHFNCFVCLEKVYVIKWIFEISLINSRTCLIIIWGEILDCIVLEIWFRPSLDRLSLSSLHLYIYIPSHPVEPNISFFFVTYILSLTFLIIFQFFLTFTR